LLSPLKQIKSGKLTKSSINYKGYNKYLKLEGEISIKIDYEKFNQDNSWDGLKATSPTQKSQISGWMKIIKIFGILKKHSGCQKPI